MSKKNSRIIIPREKEISVVLVIAEKIILYLLFGNSNKLVCSKRRAKTQLSVHRSTVTRMILIC